MIGKLDLDSNHFGVNGDHRRSAFKVRSPTLKSVGSHLMFQPAPQFTSSHKGMNTVLRTHRFLAHDSQKNAEPKLFDVSPTQTDNAVQTPPNHGQATEPPGSPQNRTRLNTPPPRSRRVTTSLRFILTVGAIAAQVAPAAAELSDSDSGQFLADVFSEILWPASSSWTHATLLILTALLILLILLNIATLGLLWASPRIQVVGDGGDDARGDNAPPQRQLLLQFTF